MAVSPHARGCATLEVAQPRGPSSLRTTIAIIVLILWLLVACGAELILGTAAVGFSDVWSALTGSAEAQAFAVIAESRLPRLIAAVLIGCALGAAGAGMQAVARNPLASPDTTGVNAGAFLLLTVVAAFGLDLGALPGVLVAFIGGLAAAALVLGLSSGTDGSAIRLVLAGSALPLGLASITSVLLLLFPWETQGLFAWGAGSLSQFGMNAVLTVLPIAVLAIVLLLLRGRSLDLLQLGDDAARSLGVAIGRERIVVIVLSVLLAACAVAVAGPIGFVGLCAPIITRLLIRFAPALRAHRTFIPMSALTGVALVLTADVLLRLVFDPVSGVSVPTGVFTSILGAVFVIALAQRMKAAGTAQSLATGRSRTGISRRFPVVMVFAAVVTVFAAVLAGILIGDKTILLGDVLNWLHGIASARIEIILETRAPRAFTAAAAGASLALAGAIVQAVTRNPLADPGVLGVSAASALGAVTTIIVRPSPSFTEVLTGAVIGAVLATLIVGVLSARDGMNQLRMVIVGIGVGAAAAALITLLLVRTDPWNQNAAITWLGGSTYAATLPTLIPMLGALIVTAVVLSRSTRELDLLQLDEYTPRTLGVSVTRSRLVHIALAVLLTAATTASIGTIAFVGLIAPHAARMLIGRRHRFVLPLSACLGAVLVVTADTVGRSAIAPSQVPAGLVTSAIGVPYFLWLLWRTRPAR